MLTELYLSDSTGPIYPGPKSRENEGIACVSVYVVPLFPSPSYVYIRISLFSYRCNRPLMCRWKRTHIAEPSSVTAFAVTHISHYWNLSSVAGSSARLRPWIDERLPLAFLPSSITTKGEDVRLRDARQPRSLFIEYLYTIQLSFKGRRGGRKGGRTLEGSRVTQTGIGCQSQTMGGPNRYVPVPGEYRRRNRQEVEVTIGHALENFDFFFFRNPFRLYREILFWKLLIIYIYRWLEGRRTFLSKWVFLWKNTSWLKRIWTRVDLLTRFILDAS